MILFSYNGSYNLLKTCSAYLASPSDQLQVDTRFETEIKNPHNKQLQKRPSGSGPRKEKRFDTNPAVHFRGGM